jgi:ribosome production factor 1
MAPDKKIPNAIKRGEMHRKGKKEKAQIKLKRRMEIRKAEKEKGVGEELKRVSGRVVCLPDCVLIV